MPVLLYPSPPPPRWGPPSAPGFQASAAPISVRPAAAPVLTPAQKQFQLFQQRQAYLDLQRRRKQLPEDVLLDYTLFDKAVHHLKTVFVTMPKAVWRGLKGESDFTFSEMMTNAKVPYYVGGLCLMASPFVGGNRLEGVRQGAAVGLYLLGMAGSNFLINTLYRLRYGVDLTMMYRAKSGQIESVFASADFPRFDLLTPRHYAKFSRGMGVPNGVYEPDGAVREQLRKIIVSSRALKLIVANIVSAVGAGYLARTDVWNEFPGAMASIKNIWRDRSLPLSGKLKTSCSTLITMLRIPARERLTTAGVPLWRKSLIWGSAAMAVLTLGYILLNHLTAKRYTPWTDQSTVMPGSVHQ